MDGVCAENSGMNTFCIYTVPSINTIINVLIHLLDFMYITNY